ncbi:MAG: hypothetical protein A4E36_02189 [Methanoregulaceae archaeon PtaB.Bin009]|jgi:hypothetical protein|nr:MAG: hypothetical protein A4E36_02189 [Methanoregulaceae archaeon PtaB.Bin009]HNQ28965.1 hypothetical protein [Methanolinea sp.]
MITASPFGEEETGPEDAERGGYSPIRRRDEKGRGVASSQMPDAKGRYQRFSWFFKVRKIKTISEKPYLISHYFTFDSSVRYKRTKKDAHII